MSLGESDGALMLGPPGTEQYRTRVAFLLLIGGLALLFWAWGSWVFRSSTPAKAGLIAQKQAASLDGMDTGPSPADRARLVRVVWQFLFFGLVIALLVIFGTYTAVRAARRYRATLEARDKKPRDLRDAWSMHKPPPLDDADDDL